MNLKRENIAIPEVFQENTHVWHLYVLRVKNRNKVIEAAKKEGVEYQYIIPYLFINSRLTKNTDKITLVPKMLKNTQET